MLTRRILQHTVDSECIRRHCEITMVDNGKAAGDYLGIAPVSRLLTSASQYYIAAVSADAMFYRRR